MLKVRRLVEHDFVEPGPQLEVHGYVFMKPAVSYVHIHTRYVPGTRFHRAQVSYKINIIILLWKKYFCFAYRQAFSSGRGSFLVLSVAVGGTWQAIPENATIESRLQRVAQTGQSTQDRRLLYVEMLKKATAAVSSGAQLVPPDTMRAIVQTFESSINTAAMISSGQEAVLGNPQAVRQPAVGSQGTREKSSVEYGGAKGRRRAQANHT